MPEIRPHANPHLTSHFLSALPFCRKIRDLKALNSLLIVHGLIRHGTAVKSFINHCCHLGFPDLALLTFKSIEKPNLYTQNLLLRSLSDNGLPEDVFSVYEKCRVSGLYSDNYTYPFVIKACAALRDVWSGNMVHCVVFKNGFGENLVVQTALLDFYSKIGQMANARKVINEMTQPDLVAWNALISGYSLNGLDYEVVKVFRDMLAAGLKPNASTLASVFPMCSRVGVHGFSVCLHGLACKLGVNEDESLVPALISVYANCGDLSAARGIFDAWTGENAAIWNAVISAYTRNQKPENAFALFKTMLMDEVNPNMVTFVSLFPSSENLDSISYVESLHACVVKYGFERQVSVVTALLSVYAKLGNVNSAEFLFREIYVKNTLIWNSMVSAYAGHGLWQQSLNAFRLMQKDGFNPDQISIISLLSSCSGLKASLLGKSAHGFSIKRKFDLNLNVINALLSFYCECRELAYSFRIFDRMDFKNIISWNTIISGCVDNEEFERAMILFYEMRQKGVDFDSVTLISILPSCHECEENPFLGSSIHCLSVKTALSSDISLANALVSMYVNCGEIDSARLLFDDMPEKSVVSWNAILTGYRQHNLQKDTIDLFSDMIRDNQKPNYVTLLNVLPECNTLREGKSVHAYIIKNVVPLETPLLTSLIVMYARYEILESCVKLFHVGDKTSISLWNTVISAHLLSKNSTMAFVYFREMIRNKVEPDFITALNLISACVQINNSRIAKAVSAFLVKSGFERDVAVSNALIDMYAKCGDIFTARMVFDELPQKDTISWSVMINGYGLHGDGASALSVYSQMRSLGLRPDKVTYISVLSVCSRAGYVEQGKMVFETMLSEKLVLGFEHYACIVDLLSRTGHLNEAYEIVKNLPDRHSANLVGSLMGACLSHGDYGLGEEIGRWALDTSPRDCGPYVVLHNIYAAGGKWVDAKNVRVAMEQSQCKKDPGISLLDGKYEHI
ncbi:pentatricopeptide repeat (PPR) superfamily protein [Striga asiatica]|uniref:Pentatricopeptide repeat (PPR) superfamily protein n=1 Tax=Striga asiatica TaxID=4170 RepID=A0A5A7PDW8_STRAF|nr:pentatricopeptide repeat (PPR) superfamily protein [Striga asiatica]